MLRVKQNFRPLHRIRQNKKFTVEVIINTCVIRADVNTKLDKRVMLLSETINQMASSGALESITRLFVLPELASKTNTYVCPDPGCGKELTLCKGPVRIPYFRHKHVEKCAYYEHPSESQIHLQAKLLVKHRLEHTTTIEWNRTCLECSCVVPFTLDKGVSDSVLLEWGFKHKLEQRIADVAVVKPHTTDDVTSDHVCIIEICHTHKTSETNRPEPWFEINAKQLLESPVMKQFQCIRTFKCNSCINKDCEKINSDLLRYDNHEKIAFMKKIIMNRELLEMFVRYRLGQREWMFKLGQQQHLRLEFHAGDEHNKTVLSLFDDIFKATKSSIRSSHEKDSCYYIIDTHWKPTYKYTVQNHIYGNYEIEYSDLGETGYWGTVVFISRILTHCVFAEEYKYFIGCPDDIPEFMEL